MARLVEQTIRTTHVEMNFNWGLDHGTWSVLCHMFPDAGTSPLFNSVWMVTMKLRSLRNRGILILGSGNMVHNLMMLAWEDTAYDWAVEFDETLKQLILSGDHDSIIHYQKFGKAADFICAYQ